MKKINHILPRFKEFDLQSKTAHLVSKALQSLGYESNLFVLEVLDAFSPIIKPIHEMSLNPNGDEKEAVFVFHSDMNEPLNLNLLNQVKGKKVLFRHFAPEPDQLAPYDNHSFYENQKCYRELQSLSNQFDLAIVDSEASQNQLLKCGYSKIHTLSPLDAPQDYRKIHSQFEVSPWILNNETTLVVGAPFSSNQRIEDAIRLFCWYQKWIHANSRLIIMGNQVDSTYQLCLQDVIHSLKIQNRVFMIENPLPMQIAAVYESADLVISTAETDYPRFELLDSLYFDVPVISTKNSGASVVFQDSGVYIFGKDIPVQAELIHSLIVNAQFRNAVVKNQKKRLEQLEKNDSILSLGLSFERAVFQDLGTIGSHPNKIEENLNFGSKLVQ